MFQQASCRGVRPKSSLHRIDTLASCIINVTTSTKPLLHAKCNALSPNLLQHCNLLVISFRKLISDSHTAFTTEFVFQLVQGRSFVRFMFSIIFYMRSTAVYGSAGQ